MPREKNKRLIYLNPVMAVHQLVNHFDVEFFTLKKGIVLVHEFSYCFDKEGADLFSFKLGI